MEMPQVTMLKVAISESRAEPLVTVTVLAASFCHASGALSP